MLDSDGEVLFGLESRHLRPDVLHLHSRHLQPFIVFLAFYWLLAGEAESGGIPFLFSFSNVDQLASSIRKLLLKVIMCLKCFLLCPRCEEPIQDIDCLYPCLLKLQDDSSSCNNVTARRFVTPTEMVLTATSCTNVRCAMSLTQQLIYQSKIWHAVDILDARQMEEAHALAATVPRQQRAVIRKAGAVPMSAPIPPVAGNFDGPGARAPDANTPANLLLHQALSERQRRMEEVRHLRQHQAPGGGASFWDSEFSDALGLGKTMYLPSDEDENKGHDNSKRAVFADEYRVLCSFGDASNLQENPWSAMRQAGSPGPETQSAPGPVVVDRPASKPRLMSEGLLPGVVQPAAAVAAPKRKRSPTSPQGRKNPRQYGSAPTGTSHDSEDAAQRSFDPAPASGPSGQQHLREQSQAPE